MTYKIALFALLSGCIGSGDGVAEADGGVLLPPKLSVQDGTAGHSTSILGASRPVDDDDQRGDGDGDRFDEGGDGDGDGDSGDGDGDATIEEWDGVSYTDCSTLDDCSEGETCGGYDVGEGAVGNGVLEHQCITFPDLCEMDGCAVPPPGGNITPTCAGSCGLLCADEGAVCPDNMVCKRLTWGLNRCLFP